MDPRYCWIDALAFQDTINEGNARWDHHDKKEARNLYEKALAYYEGPFLSGENTSPWIISARERLKNRFLGTIKRLGQWQEQVNQYEQALTCYEKGLSIDDLEESLYQRIMTCQLHLGRCSDAVRTYQRCRERLSAALEVTPSSETETLRRQVNSLRADPSFLPDAVYQR